MYHRTHWTVEKITKRLALIEPLVHRRHAYLPAFQMQELADPMTPPPLGNIDRSGWKTIEPNSHWGRRYMDFVLHTTFHVPADWESDRAVALYLPLGEAGDFSHPEALAFIDGTPHGTCDRHHQEFLLPKSARDGKQHELDLHGWTGLLEVPNYGFRSRVCLCVTAPWCRSISRRATLSPPRVSRSRRPRAWTTTSRPRATSSTPWTRPSRSSTRAIRWAKASTPACLPPTLPCATGIAKAGPALDVEVVGTGHAHIDVAWLWTLGTTRRKAGRTFTTVQRLMEQFPEYHFTQSQPQLYDYVRQDYPELFEAIKTRVAEGRWEPIGGMWVEADCNLSGPESLARQFLLGRTFFRKHFGEDKDTRVLWLPDVFGYAWNLPQLIKEAGLEYFFTIKIGWSQYNRLPYDSFWWQGLDGTKVLTHFSTTPDFGFYASTYNAMATPAQNLGTWQNFQQKELQQKLLMAFGYGDGGGGPTREMLENIREMNDFPGPAQDAQRLGGRVLRRDGGRVRRPAADLERRAVPRAAPRHLHHAEPQQARQPQERVPAARRRVPGHGCQPGQPRLCLSRRGPQQGVGAGLSQPVPRHHPRQQYRPGLRRVAGAVCRGCGDGRRRLLAGASAALSTGAGTLLIANPTSSTRSDLAFYPGTLPDGQGAGHA